MTDITDPQELVNEALSAGEKTVEAVVETPVAEKSEPVEVKEPTVEQQISPPVAEEVPLAFASPTTDPTPEPVPEPVSPNPVVPPAPEPTKATPPFVPPPPSSPPPVVPVGLKPVEPVKKKKGKKKVLGVIAAIVLLLVAVAGGIYGYIQYGGEQGKIAWITICEPMTTMNCSIGSCPGKKTCNSSGRAYSACIKNDQTCGTGGSDGDSDNKRVCDPGEPKSCELANCQSSYRTCKSDGTGWGGCNCHDIVVDEPECSATKKCPGTEVCDLKNGRCMDPGGPEACLRDDCASFGWVERTEPGGEEYCNDEGHWCFSYRVECKAPDSNRHCYVRQEIQCSKDVDPRCVDEPTKTESPTLSCTSLTKNIAAPAIGDELTLTCRGSVVPAGSTTLTYSFRYRRDAGDWYKLAASSNKATLAIALAGEYEVQCKACGTINNASVCDPVWTGATQ